MKRTKTGLLGCLLFFSAQMGFAADLSKPLALKDCISIAIENNVQLAKTEYNVQIQQKAIDQAKAGYLPTASLSAGWDRNGGEQFFGAQKSNFDQNSSSLSLSVSQNIYRGGYDRNNIKASREDAQAAELNLKHLKRDIVVQVQEKYFDLLKSQKLLKVREEDLGLSQKQLDLAEALNEVGSAAKSDVLRAKAVLAQKKLNLLNAQNEVNLANADLARTLGIDLNATFQIIDQTEQASPQPEELSFEQSRKTALTNRLDLQASQALLSSAHADIKKARSRYKPALGLSGRYTWSHNSEISDNWPNMFGGVSSWSVGLDMTFTIFDGFVRETSLQQAKLSANAARKEVEQRQQDIALEVKRAALNLQTAAERIKQAEEALAAAQEDLRLGEERYRLGVATIVDLTSAQLNYTTARQAQVEAIYDYELARANLDYATGK